MPTYKLIYFDGRGRAEVCRLLFTMGGQKFEDVRIAREEWPNVKPTTPFGQMPVLEIDGKPFGQSVALETYLAREFGYYGKTNLENLQIDQVLQLVMDFISAAVKGMRETDEAKKAELNKIFQEEEAPRFLGYFEKLLKENGNGYFVGDSLTVADLSVYNFMYGMNQRVPGFLDKCPLVKALVERVEGNDKLKSYLANRKPTEF